MYIEPYTCLISFNVKHLALTINLHLMHTCKGVFKEEGSNPPPQKKFSYFFWKSEGKEVERKRKK